MRKHHGILYTDKTCRRLFNDDERANLHPLFQKGTNGIKRRGYWIPIPNKPHHIKIFTDNCVIICKKIDPMKGPNECLPPS